MLDDSNTPDPLAIHRRPSTRSPVRLLVLLCVAFVSAADAKADSGLDLVAGFDADRIKSVFPLRDDSSVGEAAKLLFRLKKASAQALSDRNPSDFTDLEVGQLTKVTGTFASAKAYAVPQSLGDMIGIDRVLVVPLTTPSGAVVDVVVDQIPAAIQAGDRLTVTGMIVRRGSTIASASLVWEPSDAGNASWQWLSGHGVNAAELPSLNDRHQLSLVSDDANVFYAMLAAAAGSPPFPKPVRVQPIQLLRDYDSLTARYVTLPVEVIQVTRVSVSDELRRRQLSSDHYFQIDSVGQLGNTIVRIEPPAGSADSDKSNQGQTERAVFEDRYPVSIVMRDLPDFLKEAIRDREGGQAVVSDINVQVQVDGFFFRLWSYQSDYMKQFGDTKQFGPLLVAAELRNLETGSSDPLGIRMIGWGAAVFVGLAIVTIFVWHRRSSAVDQQVSRRRRKKTAPPIDLSS